MGHARAIVNISDPDTQLDIFRTIIKNDLSVRKVEEIVRKLYNTTFTSRKTDQAEVSPKEYHTLQHHLADFFQTEVELKRNNNGKGKIVIPFKSDEDLERILSIFDNLKS